MSTLSVDHIHFYVTSEEFVTPHLGIKYQASVKIQGVDIPLVTGWSHTPEGAIEDAKVRFSDKLVRLFELDPGRVAYEEDYQ